MSVNKIIYGGKTLIDLTGDTVRPEKLLKGFVAHDKTGAKITGTLFSGYPVYQSFYDSIEDSNGKTIQNSSGNTIESTTKYQKM